MIYAIGTAGGPVRLYIETDDDARAGDQCGPGEVAVAAAEKLRWASIAADGSGIVAGEPPSGWAADQLRARRTALLARCDWTQVGDAPLSPEQKAAWAAYRQELRDLPADQPDASPDTINWPEPPND